MEFDIILDFYSRGVVIWAVALLASTTMILRWMRRKDRRARLEARIREFCRKWL